MNEETHHSPHLDELAAMPRAPDVDRMHTLKVDNLSPRTSENDLRDTFGRFGEIGR